ncbi:MAG TPA: S6e family ribosomal protein, partial [Candidatus Poseidoniaceae archaeon]|nr:S6e family ribosomal protein [Candidatus Poseidoniaceae archaeon]
IGDVVEGQFVKHQETNEPYDGYKLEITGGCDNVGTPMRRDLDGGAKKPLLVTSGTGFKGHKIVNKKAKDIEQSVKD